MLRNTMTNWMKRSLAGMLAGLMLLCAVPQPVLAAAGDLGGSLLSSVSDTVQTQTLPDEPQNYRWEVSNGALATIPGFGNQLNAPTKLSGTVSGSTIKDGRYQLDTPVVLRHDRAWVLEWKGTGNWSGMLLSNVGAGYTEGVQYLFRSTATSGLIAMGEYKDGQYHNYGVSLSGMDMSAVHTYRLENRLNVDGTNMVYLVVDGVDRGAMNNYYIGGNNNQNKTEDWVSGKDFTFSYIAATQHLLTNLNLEYIQIWENGSAFDDLTISILGDSISTYTGVSNNTSYNPTLAGGAIYYTEGRLGVYRDDTWWQQTANMLGMEVLVNNSWSGSAMFNYRSNTVGAYQDRCVQLHNTAGEEPDIIAFYLGTNDFSDFMSGKCALGSAEDIDYAALVTKTDEGYTYATPTTVCEAYAIALHKTSVRYPDAEIYCLTPMQRINQNATRIAQAKQFNDAIKELAAHFGAYAVDLYNDSGIRADQFFVKYVSDNSLHPGPMGMDAITGCLISSILENSKYYSGDLHQVDYALSNVMVDQGTVSAVPNGSSFGCNFTIPQNYELSVTVTMGGKDITASCLANGKISIPAVTGDLTITATSQMPKKDPLIYRWEFDGADLSSVGSFSNALTRLAGSVSGGVHSNSRYKLAENIVLYHDRVWALEWKSEGSWAGSGSGALLFSGAENSATAGSYYLYRRQNSDLIALGTYNGSSYLNYGVVLSQHNIDGTAEHIYRLENRIAEDGSNMIWLYVDGAEVGPMNQYFVGGTNQNTTSNALSGKDFIFTHFGGNAHPINSCSIDYIQVWEGERSFADKTISILGDSISTYTGVSNNTIYNSTIGKNTVYYGAGTQGVYQADAWWQQTIDALGMKLLVNNSWSGSAVLPKRSGAAGAYVDRCVQLHNDHTNEDPDVIAVFMGTNDFSYYQSTLGTADIDYGTLITDNGDGTFAYATPSTTCEAYAIMLHKMTVRYPDAEIYCMTLLPRRAEDHDNKDVVPQPTVFNAELEKIINRFGCIAVDLEHCGIPTANEEFDRYITDQRVHPGPKGMDKMTEALVSAMLGQETKIYSVSGAYTGVKTDNAVAVTVDGMGYTANLTLAGGYSDLKVSVTMGGVDITETAYANGIIHIETVTGDIVISATAQRNPLSFRWEYSDGELVSIGDTENTLTKLAGTTTGGVLSNAYYQMDKQVVLRHDLPWMLEWRASGAWSGMILSAKQTSSAAGNTYIFKTTSNTGLVAIGQCVSNQYQNYGVPLTAQGVDTTAKHTYRLVNQPAADGTNMVYLWVDGVNYGAMDQYHVGANSQGQTADWVSGKDLTFSYIGANGHTINNCILDYIQVWEDGMPEVKWEQGTIAYATGLDRDDTKRLRTKDYLKLSDYAFVAVDSGFELVRFVYDKDFKLVNATDWLGSGVGISVTDLQTKYANGVYFRIALRATDNRELAVEDLSATGITFYAPGEEIPEKENQLQSEDLGSIGSWQDGAIWDGKLFVLNGSGSGAVYDLETLTQLSKLTLDKKDVLNPHANSVCFGSAYYAEGDKYPLLYVNVYNNYASSADRKEGTCCVYRITENDGAFTTNLVQVIRVGFTEDLTLWKSKANNGDVRPYGNFVVDTDNGKLYAFVMRDADETTRFFRFNLPALTEGTYNETYGCNVVMLERTDIEKQFDTAYFNYLQGCTYFDGKIISAEGFGSGTSAEPAIRVVDLNSAALGNTYYPAEAGLTKEPEVICVDPVIGTIYYAAADGVLRILRLQGVHAHSFTSTVTVPTCTERGYTTHACTLCGDSYVDSYVDIVWHDYDDGHCSMCGYDMLRVTPEDMIQYQGGVNSENGMVNTTFTNNWYTNIRIPQGAKQVRVLTFKTGANWGSAFLNGSDYISGFCDATVGGQWIIVNIPAEATIFRYGYLYDAIAQKNGLPLFQYVEFVGEKLEMPESSQHMERPATGCHSFTVDVNIAPAMGNPDGYVHGTDYGYIMLPTSYSAYGEPTRLIIVCHGAGASLTTYKSNAWKTNNYSFWTDMGYAVMDMYACPQELSGSDSCLHYGNPVVLDCYKAGYDYVMENFNLKQDGIYVIGSSMGGLSSFQIVQSGQFPVLAQVAYCPVIDLFKQAYCNPWTTASYQRSRIASYFGFTGTMPAFTNSKFPSAAEIAFYKQNFDKTIQYSPILQNVVAGDVTSIFDKIPTSATSTDTVEAALYAQLTTTHPCPLIIFHNTDDSTVSYRYSQYFVDMVNRSGQEAKLYTFTSGGHNAWANGKDFTLQGINGSINVKASQYEAYRFFNQIETHEEHYAWVDPAVDATCTETGMTQGSHCAVCGEVLTVQKVVPVKGHNFTKYTSDGNATLYADGTKTALCDHGCGTKDTVADVGSMLFPEKVTSKVYDITGSILGKVPVGTTVSELLAGLDWGKYCKVFGANGQVGTTETVGTGMVLKLMNGEVVKQELTIVVTGDTSGDGLITVTDFVQIKAHLLQKVLFTGAYASAADMSGDGRVTITDFVQVKTCLLQGAVMQEAQRAYIRYTIEQGAGNGDLSEYYLHKTDDGRFVTIHNGAPVGVYASQEDALTALFDDPDTTANEAQTSGVYQTEQRGMYRLQDNDPNIEGFKGKTIAFYGDSIVASQSAWQTMVRNYFGFEKTYNKGISGTRIYLNNKNAGCSYERISAAFESISEEVDYIFVIFHNDFSRCAYKLDTDSVQWVAGSTTDQAWANSEHYAKYGGDYNIDTTAGAIASTIMKLRAVMPDVEIIWGTPVSGLGTTSYQPNPNMEHLENAETLQQSQPNNYRWNPVNMFALRNLVLRTADELSVRCVDVYGTCGINGTNRAKYISDSIHQTGAGQKMLARGVIGGLKTFQTVFEQKSDWTDKEVVEYNCAGEGNAFYSYEHIQTTFAGADSADCLVLKLDGLSYAAGAPTWIPNSTADATWVASSFYTTPDKANTALGNYKGDYDLSTTAGQIASMIMKLQTVCPNTVIVFDLSGIEQAELREVIVLTAAKLSIPCIETEKASSLEESLQYVIPML